jgi:hypothetical protein
VQEVIGDVVRLTETLSGAWWYEPRTMAGTLRFLPPERLAAFLREAGFEIEQQFGDWFRSPLTSASEEVITVARRC